MEEIKIFQNSEFGEIRTVEIGNEPWFVGKDVTEILGYTNPSKALSDHVDEDDKLNNESLSSLGQRGGWLINESGLYSLILSSKLPTAKKFKHWVTSDILPSIRKHGMYAKEELLNNPDLLISVATELKAERERNKALKEENTVLLEDNQRMKPKEIFADAVSTSKTSILIGDLAKLITQNGYPIGQKRLFEWLRQNGYLIKSGSSKNMPCQRYVEQGLFEVKESSLQNPDGSVRITRTTKVSGRGQIYFVNKFVGGTVW
ncbi:MAG: phage antirepressor KilAC domain-containing protein [Clostridiales bacterium]|nr:phage antirepressor KilAC domain-containing protein [Clostridiales bacterium]